MPLRCVNMRTRKPMQKAATQVRIGIDKATKKFIRFTVN
jgi:3-methyladenine DNA glycosylase Mpg